MPIKQTLYVLLYLCGLHLLFPTTGEAACDSVEEVAAVMRLTNGDKYLAQVVCQVIAQGRILQKEYNVEMISDFSMIGRISTKKPIAAKKVYMRAGKTYVFTGACDADCSNLDLFIIDSKMNVVASDKARDDHPVIAYEPSQNGYFGVIPMLVKCRARRCAYAVLAYDVKQ